MKKSTRPVALILCALMLLSLLPAIASAEENNSADLGEAEGITEATEAVEESSEQSPEIYDDTVINDAANESVTASGTCGDNLTWALDGNGTMIISGTGAMTDYSNDSYPSWLLYKLSIKTAIIEDGVTSIGAWAFQSCRNMTGLTIPGSVISIGTNTFTGCNSLENVYYTGTISDWLNISFTNTSSSPFYGAKGNLYIGGELLTSLDIPSGIRSVKNDAFAYCGSLTSVSLGDDVESIGDYAFYRCPNLANITLGNHLENIGEWAFEGCSSLTGLSIPGSIKSFGAHAFHGCSGLTSVSISFGVTCIGRYAFSECSNLSGIIIPSSVTLIDEFAFDTCTSLTNITLPDRLANIGYAAFYKCTGLTSIILPAGVTYIDDCAFENCSNLTSVYFSGDAPAFKGSPFSNDTLTAYYSYDNETWTSSVKKDYGGSVTWKAGHAGDHTIAEDAAVAATCTTDGLTAGSHCSGCGEVFTAREVIPALGHSYNSVVVSPTCTQEGYTSHTCSRCGDSYTTDTKEAAGHKYVTTIGKPDENGTVIRSSVCSACGDTITETLTVSAAFTVSAVAGSVDDKIEVPVTLDYNQGIAAIRFQVSYDTDLLTLTGKKDGALTGWTLGASGALVWAKATDTTVTGTVVTLEFTASAAAVNCTVPITLTEIKVLDQNFETQQTSCIPGSITFDGALRGDCDGNGRLELEDLLLLKQYLAGMKVTVSEYADVNNDHYVGLIDLLLLKKLVANA